MNDRSERTEESATIPEDRGRRSTIGKWFSAVRRAAAWPFIAGYGLLKRSARLLLRVATVLIAIYVALALFEYFKLSHSIGHGGSCGDERSVFFQRVTDRSEFFQCLSVERHIDPVFKNFLLLFSDKNDASFSTTGHGYIAWMKISGSDASGGTRLHEFQTLHWGPAGEAEPPGWYRTIKPYVPKSLRRSGLDNFAVSMSRPGGYYAENESLRIYDPAGLLLTETSPSEEDVHRFIRQPETILAIAIDNAKYSELSALAKDLDGQKYHLLLHDCTELVEEAAHRAGLYVPPRLLNPFPSSLIRRMYKTNFCSTECETGEVPPRTLGGEEQ